LPLLKLQPSYIRGIRRLAIIFYTSEPRSWLSQFQTQLLDGKHLRRDEG